MLKKVSKILLLLFIILSCSSEDTPSSPPEKVPPQKIVLKDVKVVNGTIFLSWDPVTKNNYNKATLKVGKPRGTANYDLTRETISSQQYNDTISVDHEMTYSIILENDIGASESNRLTLVTEKINVTSELIDFDKIKISHSQHPIYKNFDHFRFEINPIYITDLDPEGGEYIATREITFGRNGDTAQNYGLIFTPYKNNRVAGIDTRYDLKMGEEFEKGNCLEYVYDQVEKVYYGIELVGETHANALREVYLHKLSSNDMSTISSKLITTTNEPFGHLIIDPLSNNLIIDLSFKSLEVSALDFSIINEWSAFDYIENIQNAHTYYRNGLIILENVVGNVSIFKAASKNLIYQEPFQYIFNISDNGQFFYNNYGIYEIINDNIILKTNTSEGSANPIRSIDFYETKSVYYGYDLDPVIYDLNTGVKKSIPNLNSGNFVQWNPSTNVIIVSQHFTSPKHEYLIMFYNVESETQRTIRVYDSHIAWQFYRHLDNKLIFSRGQYLENYFN